MHGRISCFCCLFAVLPSLFVASPLFAQVVTVSADYEYVMGDNDTINDGKRLCFMEAKRRCLEKAGTYVESNTEVLNYDLTRDEIKAYTAGLVKVEVVSEKVSFNGRTNVIYTKLQAKVDTSVLQSKIIQVHQNKDLARQYKQQQNDIRRLEQQIRGLQTSLKTTQTLEATEKARLEREEAFSRLSALEKIKLTIKQKTKAAVEQVELGMTRREVIDLIGQPRSTAEHIEIDMLNYGNVWVVLENGVVTCLVDAVCFKNSYRLADYFGILNPCGSGRGIIKPRPQRPPTPPASRTNSGRPCLF